MAPSKKRRRYKLRGGVCGRFAASRCRKRIKAAQNENGVMQALNEGQAEAARREGRRAHVYVACVERFLVLMTDQENVRRPRWPGRGEAERALMGPACVSIAT